LSKVILAETEIRVAESRSNFENFSKFLACQLFFCSILKHALGVTTA